MAILAGEAVDLVLHARAVARPHPLDLASEHGAAIEAGADDLVGALVGVRDPARHLLRVHGRAAHEAEHRHPLRGAAGHAVARLQLALAEVDGAAVQPWRRPSLQAILRQLEFFQACRQRHRGRIACAPGLVVVQAHMDAAVQEGAGGQHHRPGPESDADLRDGAHHPVALYHQVVHGLLEQLQVGLVLQPPADCGLVQNAVGLGPGGTHCRALAGVEDAELDATFVRGDGHGATERIDLLDQMALADAPDRGVAAHLPQGLDVVRKQQCLAAHACRRQGGLGAGVAATDHDDVELFGIKHGVGAAAGRRRTGQQFYRQGPIHAARGL